MMIIETNGYYKLQDVTRQQSLYMTSIQLLQSENAKTIIVTDDDIRDPRECMKN